MTTMSLRRYDVQASAAFVLAAVSAIPFLVAAGLIARNYDRAVDQIVYGSQSKFVIALGLSLALSMLPSAVAMLLGMSSAGQRRNERQGRSWFGFFVGGAILTLNIILALAFYKLRLEVPM